MTRLTFAALMVAVLGFGLVGCSTTPTTEEGRDELDQSVNSAVSTMRSEYPDFGAFLDKSYAYAVYPSVGEGGLIVGGGGGRGEVFKQGRLIGYSTMTKANIGLQAGGQAYSQVIVFQDDAALSKFVNQNFKFGANATAVALKSGAAANAKFQDGIAIFQHTKGGLQVAAAVGGQSFTYAPANLAPNK